MSAKTTNSPKSRMDCDRVVREEILESYVTGRLSEQDRSAFEEHYFECGRCFDDLQALQAVRGELLRDSTPVETRAGTRPMRWLPAAGIAAAVVLATGAVLWIRFVSPPAAREAANPPSSPVVRPSESAAPRPSPPQATPEPSLEQLARVEPPRYDAPLLGDAPDEATTRFQRGMARYGKGDYAGALAELRGAARLDPAAPHISFFLGISHLMLGQDTAAIERLRATIALGDSPYLEGAHFYMAKAFLRQKDLGAAETELRTLIQLQAGRSDQARQLLTQVERLKPRLE